MIKLDHTREGGPGVQLGGARPEPKPTEAAPQPDAIATLRSWEPESKLDLRRRLNRIALLATSRAQSARSPDARAAFWHVASVAGAWVFATASEEALNDMRHGLLQAGMAADAFERNGSGE